MKERWRNEKIEGRFGVKRGIIGPSLLRSCPEGGADHFSLRVFKSILLFFLKKLMISLRAFIITASINQLKYLFLSAMGFPSILHVRHLRPHLILAIQSGI